MFRKFSAALFVAAAVVPATASSAAPVVDRDEFSTTTRLPDGTLKTSLSSEPQNFRSGEGWKAVNTKLEEKADGALGAVAVDGTVVIPEALGAPVELGHRGNEVTFRLIGASGGDADVEGSAATFADALNGVDARYAATATGVKETLVLATAASPNIFKYDVRADPSWTASLDQGAVVLGDNAGRQRYRIDAPLAWDSAADPSFTNDLALTVEKVAAGRWTVTLRPNAEWLDDEDRVYPVSIDPDFSWSNGTTNFHGAIDTYLASGDQANSVFSASSYMQTGHYNRVYKSLLKFDIAAAIPANATVSSATFKAYAPPATPKSIASHSLRTVTSDWDANANWNRRKVGVSWGTSGGDVSSSSAHTSAAVNVQVNPGWYSWTAPLATVQGWVDGSLSNYGFQLATNSGAPSGNSYVWASTQASTSSTFPADSTKWPTLDVTWTAADTLPPPEPDDVWLSELDVLTDTATLSFACPEDVAPAGITPSGTVGCDVQIAKNGGAYTAWQLVTNDELPIIDVNDGDIVDVRLRSRDAAGNVSSVVEETLDVLSRPDYRDETAQSVAYLAETYGYSEAEAEAWLAVHQAVRVGLNELQAAAGSTYSTYWFDNVSRKVHLQVVGTARDANIEESAEFLGIDQDLVVDHVDQTEAELLEDANDLSAALESLIDSRKVDVVPFTPGSEILVMVDPSASTAERAAITAAVAANDADIYLENLDDPLPAEEEQSGCKRNGGRTFCDFPVRAGVSVAFGTSASYKRCSSGFVVDKAVAPGQKLSDESYVLTAAHCVPDSQLAGSDPASSVGNLYQFQRLGDIDVRPPTAARLGQVAAGDRFTGRTRYDFAAAKLEPSAKAAARAMYQFAKPNSKSAGRAKTPTGVESPVMGAMSCVGGTRGSRCVDVLLTHQGSRQAQYFANTCRTEGGDSGGAATYRGRAQGSHVGRATTDKDSKWVDALRAAWARELPDQDMPPLARCEDDPDTATDNDLRGYAREVDITVIERLLGVRVRTRNREVASFGDGVRFSMSWESGADIDLHAFYRPSPGEGIVHAEWRHPNQIPGGHLKIDLVPSNGPETFTESPGTQRQITFAACHYGITGPNHGVTQIEGTLHDPTDGENYRVRVDLSAQGQGDFFGTSPRGGTNDDPGGAWCDTGDTGYPVPTDSPDNLPTIPGDS